MRHRKPPRPWLQPTWPARIAFVLIVGLGYWPACEIVWIIRGGN